MRKQNQNAEHTTRFGSCDENRSTVFSFCDAAGSWDAPAAELDMFSRWIKLADDALARARGIARHDWIGESVCGISTIACTQRSLSPGLHCWRKLT